MLPLYCESTSQLIFIRLSSILPLFCSFLKKKKHYLLCTSPLLLKQKHTHTLKRVCSVCSYSFVNGTRKGSVQRGERKHLVSLFTVLSKGCGFELCCTISGSVNEREEEVTANCFSLEVFSHSISHNCVA
jgi:hypothetical protein